MYVSKEGLKHVIYSVIAGFDQRESEEILLVDEKDAMNSITRHLFGGALE